MPAPTGHNKYLFVLNRCIGDFYFKSEFDS